MWADSVWAPRFSDTLQPLGQPGNPLSPPSWKPLVHQTCNLCLPPIPTLRSQPAPTPNHIVSANECTLPPTQITWCGTSNTQIPKQRTNNCQPACPPTPFRRPSSSPKQPKTSAHLQQPNSEAYEADDRCFQVSLARRLVLPHPAPSQASNVSATCTNVSAAKRTCACSIDSHQLHCMTCKSGVGVDQRHSVLARCLADLITAHTGTKAFIEQSIPGLTHIHPDGSDWRSTHGHRR